MNANALFDTDIGDAAAAVAARAANMHERNSGLRRKIEKRPPSHVAIKTKRKEVA